MSLLWPESVIAGLFPGQCWLRRGRAGLRFASGLDAQPDPSILPTALDALLAEHATGIAKGVRLHLTVSDSAAAIVMLPWQEQLSSPEELRGYALANFERHGLEVGDGWSVRTVFRQYRAAGIAFAVATPWLLELRSVAESRGLRLASVLPVSLAAYHRHRHPAGVKRNLLLLREAHRISAMVYEKGDLRGIDVEPVIGSGAEASGRRLLRRLGAVHGEVDAMDDWAGVRQAEPAAFIGECLPQAARRPLPPDVWS